MSKEQNAMLRGAPTPKVHHALDTEKNSRKPIMSAPTFKSVMLLMLWKNLTIRKRRKVEQLLMLFQIFIWFGWGASRFLFRSQLRFMPAVAPTSPADVLPFNVPLSFPSNHPIAIAVPVLNGQNLLTSAPEIIGSFKANPAVDPELLIDTISVFGSLLERTVGAVPLMKFDGTSMMRDSLREDPRFQYGIVVERLLRDDPNITIDLIFWNNEIPVSTTEVPQTESCRTLVNKIPPNFGLKSLNLRQNCIAGQYLRSPFVLAESLLVTSVYRAKAKAKGSINDNFITNPKLRTPTAETLEFPGVTVVAEPFPLRLGLQSHFAELAAGTPLFTMFAFSRFMMTAIHDLVGEKESKLKEVMKIFGLTNTQYWFSWLLTVMSMNVMYTGVTLVICRLCNMFPDCSFAVVATIYYFYLLSLLTSGMFLSVFFEKQQSAGAVGLVLNLFLNGVGWLLTILEKYPRWVRTLATSVSTITFSLAMDEIIRGLPMRPITMLNWFNFQDNNIGMYTIMLIVNAFGYFILGWYFDSVLPGSFGSTKPWYFPLVDISKFVWRGLQWLPDKASESELHAKLVANTAVVLPGSSSNGFIEPAPQNLRDKGLAVQIRNLVKEFSVSGETKRAVDNFSIDIYKSEIFALLGHNGAGKTTTINVLTGMTTANSGDIVVNGFDLKTNPIEVQRSISVCPQHNIFMDELLCIEHLCFFAGLRGLNIQNALLRLQNPAMYASALMEEFQQAQLMEQIGAMMGQLSGPRARSDTKTWEGVLEMIKRFELTPKLFTHPRTLSGGQKRRLWLALALIGEPHVVFLDEPTSGVDPVGRQDIWKVIQEERKSGRCVILTTHHMEEADILADRKAVMSSGRLRCLGSSLFLKKKFGIGYYFEAQFDRNQQHLDELIDCRNRLVGIVRRHVPLAQLVKASEKDIGTKAAISMSSGMIIFALPLNEISAFGPLLSEVEELKEEMHIVAYAMSMSTLEEVFFKLGEVEDINDLEALSLRERGRNAGGENIEPLGNMGSLGELGVHGRRKSSTALGMEDDAEEDDDNLGTTMINTVPDLTQERFEEVELEGKSIEQFKGISYLRYAQVFHSKGYFVLDIILPTVLFLAGLFVRGEGPGGVDRLFLQEQAYHNFRDYEHHLNSTIPYMVDPNLSEFGLKKVAMILENLPFKKNMMPLLDFMDSESLKEQTPTSMSIKLRTAMELNAAVNGAVVFEEDPMTGFQYLKRRPTPVKKFSDPATAVINEEDFPYIFKAAPEMTQTLNAPGFLLRNFVWHTTKADVFGVGQNFYPGAVYFEPGLQDYDPDVPLTTLRLSVDNVRIRYMWNPYATHAFPAFLNGLGESVLRSSLDEPIELSLSSKPIYKEIPVFVTNLTWALYTLLSLGLSSLPQRFGTQVMVDTYTKTKHSLIVMGCPLNVYWYGTFFTNWVIMIIANTFVVGAVAYFIPLYLRHPASLVAAEFAMLTYSGAMLVYGYFWTFIFTSSRSYNLFMNLSIVSFAIGPAYIVSLFHDAKYEVGAWSLRKLSGIIHRFASFTLAPYTPIGMMISAVMVINQAEAEKRTASFLEFFSIDNGVMWTIAGAIFQTLVYGSIILYIDQRTYKRKIRDWMSEKYLKDWKEARTQITQQVLEQTGSTALVPAQFKSMKDKDVVSEEKRVTELMHIYTTQLEARNLGMEIPRYFPNMTTRPPKSLPLIIMEDLHHLYMPSSSAGEPHVAVKGLSFAVSPGEVLGILGPNGAGKSTSINLLTCDPFLSAPCEGDGYLGGISMTNEAHIAFPYIGVVPQFDALWPDVTVRDNLVTFAMIKGIPEGRREARILEILSKLGLVPHSRKRIKELSGGNKRRTSVAVALIGDPKVVLMDEPSSGIDPEGRRQLLKIIRDEGKSRAIVITTHSMEEAESLCSRIGIMVNGEMQCLNTCLSIKNNYGSGIRMEVELAVDWAGAAITKQKIRDNVIAMLQKEIDPRTFLTEELANRLFFTIPLPPSALGRIFQVMYENSKKVDIKDYAIAQPTLDHVFIHFAKQQAGNIAPAPPVLD